MVSSQAFFSSLSRGEGTLSDGTFLRFPLAIDQAEGPGKVGLPLAIVQGRDKNETFQILAKRKSPCKRAIDLDESIASQIYLRQDQSLNFQCEENRSIFCCLAPGSSFSRCWNNARPGFLSPWTRTGKSPGQCARGSISRVRHAPGLDFQRQMQGHIPAARELP